MRRRARKIDPAVTARRQDDGLCAEAMQRSIHQRPGNDAAALALHHDEVEYKILDEKLGTDPQGLPIECVDQSVSRSIRRCARARDRIFAEVAHVTTERPLIDFSMVGMGDWHLRLFRLNNGGTG